MLCHYAVVGLQLNPKEKSPKRTSSSHTMILVSPEFVTKITLYFGGSPMWPISFGTSGSSLAYNFPTFFGQCIGMNTMSGHPLSKLLKANLLYPKVVTSLKTMTITVQHDTVADSSTIYNVAFCVYNNSQQNQQFKYQHFGKSLEFMKKGTARIYINTWQGLWKNIVLPDEHPEIKYAFEQLTPSPYDFLPYAVCNNTSDLIEDILTKGAKLQSLIDNFPEPTSTVPVDFKGKQVIKYMQHHVKVCN